MSRVHPQARTTPRTRAEIRSCEAPLTVLAERYNVTKATVRKWRGREDMQDRSHRPNTLSTTLRPAQEALVVELRRTLLLPLDDLLALTHEFINRAASRSGLDRCLRRHRVSNLAALIPAVEGEAAPKKIFKDCEPGYVHVDMSTSSACRRCRRNPPALPRRCHRPGHALGILPHLQRPDRDQGQPFRTRAGRTPTKPRASLKIGKSTEWSLVKRRILNTYGITESPAYI